MLADLQLPAQGLLAVAKGPHTPELAAGLRARYDEPPVANGQSAVGPALARLEVLDREVGQRTGVRSTKGLFITTETHRHAGRHSGVAAGSQL